MKRPNVTRSLRISILYAIITGAWIIFSDRLLLVITEDFAKQTALQTVKGLLFIIFTAGLIYVLLHRELTMQDQMLVALRNSEAHWRSLVENAPDVIFTVNRQGEVLFANRSPDASAGKSPATGASVFEFFPPEYHPTIRTAINHVFETGQPTHFEIATHRSDGAATWFYTRLGPIKYNDAVREIILISRDITDHKQAEMAVQQTLSTLHAIVEASPLAIIHLDPDGTVKTWSAAAERIFGWSSEEAVGKLLPYVSPENREEFESMRTSVLSGKIMHSIETDRRRKDGTSVAVAISTAPMRGAQGDIIGILGIVEDITTRKAAEAEIRRLNAELEQRVEERTEQLRAANKELEAFAYSVSHDLRAPLRAIDGFSRIIEEDYAPVLDAEGIRLLDIVRSNVQQMDRLITDLLALSRTSRSEMKMTHIDMTSMAESMYYEIAPPDAQQTFSFNVAPLPDAVADSTLMRQVWGNLIANAIKYTMPKDERRIDIDGWEDKDTIVYSIKDTGVGFNPDYSHKLFNIFQRLHKAEDFDGTGVGLAIVQRIIHRHGGQVWAESQVDRGATFYFSLKRRPEDG